MLNSIGLFREHISTVVDNAVVKQTCVLRIRDTKRVRVAYCSLSIMNSCFIPSFAYSVPKAQTVRCSGKLTVLRRLSFVARPGLSKASNV